MAPGDRFQWWAWQDSWLDLIILEVFSSLNNFVILIIVQPLGAAKQSPRGVQGGGCSHCAPSLKDPQRADALCPVLSAC